jgi:hypothetical protein
MLPAGARSPALTMPSGDTRCPRNNLVAIMLIPKTARFIPGKFFGGNKN